MKPRTVVSMEQALSLPYATLRFAQLGWRVIKIEAVGGGGLPGIRTATSAAASPTTTAAATSSRRTSASRPSRSI
ncbi:MAG: hypothetical protein M5U08_17720 [Burkholderiales bacterium]|nr:hypothetical protein [Burkholderiales bacterium]